MTRILVRPEDLQQLSGQLRHTAYQLRAEASRLNGAMAALDWDLKERAAVDSRVIEARHQAAMLAGDAEAMAAFLADRAERFLQADARGVPVQIPDGDDGGR